MLLSLQIQNYALINELDIEFSKGFITITGETGAGKSILLGALSLILGVRADARILKNKDRKCYVEGVLDHADEGIDEILTLNDIDKDNQLILRREINPNGKSRAFVNDTPVNLQVLRDIGVRLVDIHSQHENLELNNNLYQLMVVDAFAGLTDQVKTYRESYRKFRQIASELEILKENANKVQSELDYLTYQFREISDAAIYPGETDELEKEAAILRHAGEIKSGLFSTGNNISGDDVNAVSLLKASESELEKIMEFHVPSSELRKRMESIIIELKDIAADAESLGERIEIDPSRLQFIEERLNLLYSLQQKHRLGSVEELIGLKDNLHQRITSLGSHEFRMEELEKQVIEQKQVIHTLAEELSRKREKAFPRIEEKIVELLVQLGMPNARFKVLNETSQEPGLHGFDNVRFLFTANKKTELQDISRIASGGELSRLMLSIKYIISGSLGLPSIIFDEIDAGVSGETAFRVGSIMRDMSCDRQVFAITHLPQVAAMGDIHYLVFKNESDSGTATGIKLLSRDERIGEIAKMLSGEQTTGAAFQNAKELLGIREE